MGPDVSSGGGPPRTTVAPPPLALASHSFTLAVEEQGATLYLRMLGEFDGACVPRMEAALEPSFKAKIERVVLDLSALGFLDSAGLRAILRANERARRAAFELVVVRPRGFANRIFTLTRAGERLNLADPPSRTNDWSQRLSRR